MPAVIPKELPLLTPESPKEDVDFVQAVIIHNGLSKVYDKLSQKDITTNDLCKNGHLAIRLIEAQRKLFGLRYGTADSRRARDIVLPID